VSYITTRYYRAPELIIGAQSYGNSIDIWSAGCVLAELLCGEAFFKGQSGQTQLVEIIKKLGTPTQEDMEAMNPDHSMKKKLQKGQAIPMEQLLPKETEETAVDLLKKLFVYKPGERLTAVQALCHPFFDELREENLVYPTGNCLPDIFSFTPYELDHIEPAVME